MQGRRGTEANGTIWTVLEAHLFKDKLAAFAVSSCRVQGAGCRVQGAGCRVQGSGRRVQLAGCRILNTRFRVQGAG